MGNESSMAKYAQAVEVVEQYLEANWVKDPKTESLPYMLQAVKDLLVDYENWRINNKPCAHEYKETDNHFLGSLLVWAQFNCIKCTKVDYYVAPQDEINEYSAMYYTHKEQATKG